MSEPQLDSGHDGPLFGAEQCGQDSDVLAMHPAAAASSLQCRMQAGDSSGGPSPRASIACSWGL